MEDSAVHMVDALLLTSRPDLVDRLCTHTPHQWNLGERVQVHQNKSWRDATIVQRRLKDDMDIESWQFKTSLPATQWIGASDRAIRPPTLMSRRVILLLLQPQRSR